MCQKNLWENDHIYVIDARPTQAQRSIMLGQAIFLVLLTAFTFIQGVQFLILGSSTTAANVYILHSTSIGYYCYTEGLSGPLYANSKCSPRPEINRSFRPLKCIAEEPDNSQARFSAQLVSGEYNLKCKTAKHPKVPSPPLEVVPLIMSGPSTNRVDFVFFSDGCEFVIQISFIFLTWGRQTLQMNVKNSSKMQDV